MIPSLNCHYKALTKREIIHVLDQCSYCLLGTAQDNQAYIVPMYYDYRLGCNELVFTMFSLHSGQKMNNMTDNSQVCLEFNHPEGDKLQTVIVMGTVSMTEIGYDRKCQSPIYKLKIDTLKITGREYRLNHCH